MKNNPRIRNCAMTKFPRSFALVLGAIGILSTWSASAQTPPKTEELIKLNAFEVSSRKVGPYQVSDTTSGGRIRTDIFESTQGISVVTKELIQDHCCPVINN